MGVVADFFVSSEADALSYAAGMETVDPDAQRVTPVTPVRYKGFSDLEVGTLWAILEGQEWDEERHMPEETFLGDDGESWLNRFPDELTHLLAQTSEASLSQARPG
ncbi:MULTISPECIES: hypothetical protein [unclassified Pseudomonas]|uniref:hypothetical protein n=1 Tax=unclassified Pseudomonas TaxID=196821 RepID=UPI000BCA0F0C|nr:MULTISPECIES: hypothetical protein [unclassified Pseudomonas]PVZ20176.1 hypothetical protein F474_00769 [Pseudomonas sp. URIL14HWK12:I12]PVZ27242.1 hypothetical protein F470_00424 [Pseudomonas sp. URIL14HWK12:I10]PVZ38131.1 hypothetical protein F472_00769 [Pseudomonas sp. URIL14HWK12:I11]SNZ04467.1 hypothetical protein SAMN05660463_00635 [Pseudomonas sp. URIL14HWK12:I9]